MNEPKERAEGVRLLHGYITVKSKESNFKGAGLGETQFGSDPGVGSAVGAELCGEGEAPVLAFFARGERSEVVRGFTCFDQGFLQDSLPAFFTEQLGLDLGQSDQGELPEFLGQGGFPSLSTTFFAASIK